MTMLNRTFLVFGALVAPLLVVVTNASPSPAETLPNELHRSAAEWLEDEQSDGVTASFFNNDDDSDDFFDHVGDFFNGNDDDDEVDDDDFEFIPDWLNFDWLDFDFDGFNWCNKTWGSDEWRDFLDGLWGGATDDSEQDWNFCSILEAAVGIGHSFGVAGDCSCSGSPHDDLAIQCTFYEECVEGLPICGDVTVELDFGDDTATVENTICVDIAASDQFDEVCFSYELDMTATQIQQSCEATYGGNPCDCTLENVCLAIDCSAYLPGARMDTCQFLAFEHGDNATSLVPQFPIFDFDDMLPEGLHFYDVNWTHLDWDNLDWDNFDFGMINWTDVDFDGISWGSLFGDHTTDEGVCTALGRALAMDDHLSDSCLCADTNTDLGMWCWFEEVCDENAGLCGNLTFDFGFDTVDAIDGGFCFDFYDDIHPLTCLNYTIPVANQDAAPTCEASYGGEPCECTISDNFCVLVDCSAYEESAIMDTCQVLSLDDPTTIMNFVPGFAYPEVVAVTDGESSSTETVESTQTAAPENGETEVPEDNTQVTVVAAGESTQDGSGVSGRGVSAAFCVGAFLISMFH